LLDESVHLRKAEPGSLRLGGVERLEHLALRIRRHAAAGVAQRDQHVVARRDFFICRAVALVEEAVRGFDRQLAAIGHRIARVDRDVENRALELVAIHRDPPEPAREDRLDSDTLAERAPQQLGHAGHQLVRIQRLGLERLPAREGEQPLRQAGSPVDAAARGFDVSRDVLVARAHPALDQVDRALDDGQQVVEVVRDAAGQLAEPFHLLRLHELGLRLLERLLPAPPLGDVARDLRESAQAPRRVVQGIEHHVRPESRSVLAHPDRFGFIPAFARRNLESALGRAGRPVLRREEAWKSSVRRSRPRSTP
jgi:hypothetical protein